MTSGSHPPFPLTNIVANRLLVPLLRSRPGRRLGRRIAMVEYLGRRPGQHHQLFTHYVKEGGTVRIEVGMFDRKRGGATSRPSTRCALGLPARTTT
jgi:hypothetical protein